MNTEESWNLAIDCGLRPYLGFAEFEAAYKRGLRAFKHPSEAMIRAVRLAFATRGEHRRARHCYDCFLSHFHEWRSQ